MQAKIITIGDEILVGQTIDTNSTHIAKALNAIGIKVSEILSITDTEPHILKSVEEALHDNDFIILTGGLGPTNDDITKKVLTAYFDDELVLYPEVLKKIQDFFIRFNKPFLPVNKLQAMLPKNAEIIENDLGTASGMLFQKGNSLILSLPGVPFEMKGLFAKFIEKVKSKYALGDFYHQTLLLAGIGESYLADMIKDWEAETRAHGVGVAYLPSIGELKLRLTGTLDQKVFIDQQISYIQNTYPKYVVGNADDKLENVIGQLLLKSNKKLGTIESCTGGALAQKIVSVSGSSAYYEGSIISYSYLLKENLVGVNGEVILKEGAVSEAVVREMAEKGRTKLGVDYCISISGVAGPEGGTDEKPVGTVWIAIASIDNTVAKQFNFGYNRSRNIQSSVVAALNFLRLVLTNQI